MQKVFLDTNVLIDWLMLRDGFENARLIICLATNGHFSVQASALTMSTISYVYGRHVSADVFYDKLHYLDSFLDVVSVSNAAYKNAVAERWDDFEDALQHFSAMEAQADCIVTRNTKDFTQSAIPVMTPEDFLDAMDV